MISSFKLITVTNLSLVYFLSVKTILSQDISVMDKKDLILSAKEEITFTADSITHRQTEIYNGKIHFPVANSFNHPYLGENKWVEGNLDYLGKTYQARLLKYNIYTDHLIILPFQTPNSYPISINRNFLHGFSMSDRTFRYITDVRLAMRSIPDGYFEMIYDGKTRFMLKWMKDETLNSLQRQVEYEQQLKMLLRKDDRYYRIRNKIGLMYRLRDKRKEIRQFIRENNIVFNINQYSSVSRILEYYENL